MGGGPLFFVFFDTAYKGAIGEKIVLSGKTLIRTWKLPVSFRDNIRVSIYRLKFQREIYKELRILEKSIGEGDEESSNLNLFSLEMFENIAYTMAKHADPQIPNEVDEWLDGFNTLFIYQVLSQLIEL